MNAEESQARESLERFLELVYPECTAAEQPSESDIHETVILSDCESRDAG
jgi:hypothetical protein